LLPGFDAIDHAKFDSEAKIEAASETTSLRARHLEGAVLIGAKLRKADFTAAQLRGSQFDRSDLRGAKFECATFDPNPQQCAQLQGASLIGAELQGARLDQAELQGALLDHAQLQGASLYVAQLQVASLQGAELQGASHYNANLQGTSFNYAQLQGTWFYGADLEGAELRNVHVWRTDARQAWPKENTYVEYQEIGPTYKCDGLIGPSDCDQLANAFEKLEQLITDQVPEGRLRSEAMKRIEQPQSNKGPGGRRRNGESLVGSSPRQRSLRRARRQNLARDRLRYRRGALRAFDTDKAKLKEIRDRSPPPASKP
jgi:uncharacterized protein YjbI with pentapeptide repeats